MTLATTTVSGLTRVLWLRWQWLDVTGVQDAERKFVRGRERTPDEMLKAEVEWRLFQSVRDPDAELPCECGCGKVGPGGRMEAIHPDDYREERG